MIPIAADDLPVTMPDGSEVSHKWYVDNVLTLRNTGLICVKVKRAENVVGDDTFSKADSYVRLHIKGPNKSKTEIIMNDNDPTWNQSLYMLVDDVQERKLAIEVMDSDETRLGKDFRVASKEVPLRELGLVANETKDAWFEFPETAERNAEVKRSPAAPHEPRDHLRPLRRRRRGFQRDVGAPARRGNAHRASHPSERTQGFRFEW